MVIQQGLLLLHCNAKSYSLNPVFPSLLSRDSIFAL